MNTLKYISILCCLVAFSFTAPTAPTVPAVSSGQDVFKIKKTADFEISGDGIAENWNLTEWVEIEQRRGKDTPRSTKAKILYSETGIYFLFFCEDKQLTSTMNADNLHL